MIDFSNYDAISFELGLNKYVTSFDYITENHELGNSEILNNDTQETTYLPSNVALLPHHAATCSHTVKYYILSI